MVLFCDRLWVVTPNSWLAKTREKKNSKKCPFHAQNNCETMKTQKVLRWEWRVGTLNINPFDCLWWPKLGTQKKGQTRISDCFCWS